MARGHRRTHRPVPPSFANIGKYTVTGAEGSLGWRPHDDVALYVGASWMDPGPDDVPDLPQWTFSAGLNWRASDHVRLNVDLENLASRMVLSERWPSQRTELDGFTLLNARVVGTIPLRETLSRLELFLAAENLTDETYAYRPRYPMPGRTWMLGVVLGFQ